MTIQRFGILNGLYIKRLT